MNEGNENMISREEWQDLVTLHKEHAITAPKLWSLEFLNLAREMLRNEFMLYCDELTGIWWCMSKKYHQESLDSLNNCGYTTPVNSEEF